MADRMQNRILPDGDDGESKRPLISVALLPSAATLGNLICGVMAIFCCMLAIRAAYFDFAPRTANQHLLMWFPSYIAVGAYLIILAAVFDALDGRLARMTRHTTEFGAQLDSIADIVSFGVAPALLFLSLLLPQAVALEGEPLVDKVEWRLGLLGALVYVSCSAIRLARYNAENVEEEAAQPRFRGLPTPGGAAGMVALLVLHEDLVFEQAALWGVDWAGVIRRTMGVSAFLLGLLMVSRVNYVHVFNRYFHREQPLWHLVWFVVLVGIGFISPQILLVVLATLYIFSGLVIHLKNHGLRHAFSPRRQSTEMETAAR